MTNIEKATVLIQALPYIEKYRGKTMVVKYGGSAMISDSLQESVMEDLILMSYIGINIVLVHGGGNEINAMLSKIGKEAKFVDGLRYTDKETIEVVEMVLSGKVNKGLVAKINSKGGKAIGICGVDDNMLLCKKKTTPQDLGYVGEIIKVNGQLINHCLNEGYISVIATLGVGEDGQIYNINGDTAAAHIACELKAEKLILLTDVPGVLMDTSKESSVISEIKVDDIPELMNKGIITGGMIPKIKGCVKTLKSGVSRVHILDATIRHSLITELFTDEGVGTLIY